MRVPVLGRNGVSARPVGAPYERLNYDTGDGELARGMGQLSQGLSVLDEARRHAEDKANAVGVNDGLTQLQRSGTLAFEGDSTGAASKSGEFVPGQWGLDLSEGGDAKARAGFLSLRGQEAAKYSTQTLESLQKRRKEIAEGLANDKQRELFRQKSDSMLEQFHGRIESHVATEVERANIASMEAGKSEGLKAIASDFDNDKAAAETSARVESSIRALALSNEDANAKAQAWRGEVAETRLGQYLATKNWAKAEALYESSKGVLGPKGEQYAKAISTLKQDMEGERIAAQMVSEARDAATGRVDSAKALETVDALEPGPLKDEVRQRLEHRVGIEERAWKQQTEAVYLRAFSAYETGGHLGAIDARDKAWLLKNAPEEWHKLRMMAQDAADRARKARERGERAPREVETPEQRAALVALKADMAQNPDVYRDMSPEEWTATNAHNLSKSGYREAGNAFTSTKKEPKGSTGDWARFLRSEVQGNDGFRANKVRRDEWLADMETRRLGFVDRNKRQPTLDEMEAMRAASFVKITTDVGWLWDSEKFAYQTTPEERAKVGLVPPKAHPRDWSPSAGGKVTAEQIRDARNQLKVAPPKPGMRRVRDSKGRTGWWDGKTPLPSGVTEVSGG